MTHHFGYINNDPIHFSDEKTPTEMLEFLRYTVKDRAYVTVRNFASYVNCYIHPKDKSIAIPFEMDAAWWGWSGDDLDMAEVKKEYNDDGSYFWLLELPDPRYLSSLDTRKGK